MKYLIAIGGTGMRCLESFVHLCAIGMFSDDTINILLIDTDYNNGNKGRTESLLETYNRIKGTDNNPLGKSYADSFFSAKLNVFKFYPHYEGVLGSFAKIREQASGIDSEVKRKNQMLSDLLIDKNAQSFNLEHGYRAQTHLGSFLMYHSILEEVSKRERGVPQKEGIQGIADFVNSLTNDNNARVFILGSIFGGTGASSIPVIPRALKRASQIQGSAVSMNEAIFGSTLLTNYFTFSSPNQTQLEKEKVIANAQRFALNSQAALMFYSKDRTVENTFQRLYFVGWPDELFPYDKSKDGSKVQTGGLDQENTAHVIELLCAFAAYDFFKSENIQFDANDWKYRSVKLNEGGKLVFDFVDFAGNAPNELLRFKQKLSAFYGFCFLIQNGFLRREGDAGTKGFYQYARKTINDFDRIIGQEISDQDLVNLEQYIKYFSFQYNHGARTVSAGWLHQIRHSVSDSPFMFVEEAYSNNFRNLQRFEWGNLFKEESNRFGNRAFWSRGFLTGAFNAFVSTFREEGGNLGAINFHKPIEKWLYWIYQTFNKLHKLEEN